MSERKREPITDLSSLSAEEFLAVYKTHTASVTGLPPEIYDEYPLQFEEDTNELLKWRADYLSSHPEIPHEEPLVRSFRAPEGDYMRFVAHQLISCLPSPEKDTLAHIPVGTLPTPDLNAATLLTPAGDHIVVVNLGLHCILHEIAKAIVSCLPLPDTPAEMKVEEATLHMFRWITTLARAVPVSIIDPNSIQHAAIEKRALVGGLVQNALNFVIGHELEHICRDHLSHSSLVEVALPKGTSLPPLQLLSRSQSQELEADQGGCEKALHFAERIHDGHTKPAFMGIELMLRVIDLFEHFANLPGPMPTHPLAIERLASFHESYSVHFDSAVHSFVNRIGPLFEICKNVGRQTMAKLGWLTE